MNCTLKVCESLHPPYEYWLWSSVYHRQFKQRNVLASLDEDLSVLTGREEEDEVGLSYIGKFKNRDDIPVK